MLTGENGVLTKATVARDKTELTSEKEQVSLAVTAAGMSVGYSIDKTILREELGRIDGMQDVPADDDYTFPLTVIGRTGNNYIITNDGKVSTPQVITSGETATGGNATYVDASGTYGDATIPEGFTVSNIDGETSVANGLVIYDIPESDLDKSDLWTATTTDINGNTIYQAQVDYNQYVWIPVDKATFATKFKRTEGYENGSLQSYIEGDCGEANANGVNIYLEANSMTENSTTVEESKKMYASVAQYGGFYIGRYEAGTESSSARTSSSGITDNMVIKRNAYVYNYINWANSMTEVAGGAVEKSRTMAFANGNVKATQTLCYGVLWDAALNFIDSNYITNETEDGNPNCSSDSYVRNGTGKGWYYNNYRTGNSEHKTGIDVDSNSSNSQKNIYDMAGNVSEWTMESLDTKQRIHRGRGFDSGTRGPASLRRNCVTWNGSCGYIGFRSTLYL